MIEFIRWNFVKKAIHLAKILDDKKAEDVTVLHVAETSSVWEYFVIASGTSNTHVKSLADDVEYEIKERFGIDPQHIEGRATGWILLDYGSVIVHVFGHEDREYYNLERLWADASIMDLSDVVTPE